MLVALLALACSGSGSSTLDDTADPTGGGDLVLDLEIEQSAVVATVTTVRWRTAEPTLGRVRFGEGDDRVRVTPLPDTPTTDHQVALVGMPEDAGGTLVVEIVDGGEVIDATEPLAFETGLLPAALPRPSVVELDPSATEGGLTLVPFQASTDESHWLTILDEQGRVVWAYEVPESCHRLRLAADQRGLLFYTDPNGDKSFVIVDLDFAGNLRWEFEVQDGRQDFAAIDDDTFVVLASDEREFEFADGSYPVMGDRLLEVGRNGSVRELWNTFERFEPNTELSLADIENADGYWDFTHANYLHYEAATDRVWVTLRNVHAAVGIDHAAGEPVVVLSETLGDYTHNEEHDIVENPHSVQPLADSLLVFNQGDPAREHCARAVVLSYDDVLQTVDESWRYEPEDCFLLDYLGNAQRLPGGNTLVDFSTTGVLDEVTADGRLAMRLELPLGSFFNYAERLPAEVQPW